MRLISILLGVTILADQSPLYAQELLRSTGTATRSYNYFEIQYLTDSDASPPVFATLVMDITDSISFVGEYYNQSLDFFSKCRFQ